MKIDIQSFKEEFSKYAIISLIGYPIIFIILYILVDVFGINKSIAFFITYTISYIIIYFVQLKLIFKKSHSFKKSIKFLIHIGVFFLLVNLIFNGLIIIKIQYLIATALTIVILFPIRFLSYKFFVYR